VIAWAPSASPGVIGADLIALRRRLHQISEIGLHLPLTQQAVLEAPVGRFVASTKANIIPEDASSKPQCAASRRVPGLRVIRRTVAGSLWSFA
jgi:hypothetical protein